MQESPVFKRQVRYWVLPVGYSCFKVAVSVNFIEPNSEFGVSNSWRSIAVEISDFDFVSEQMGNCMGSYGCTQTVTCDSINKSKATQDLDGCTVFGKQPQCSKLVFGCQQKHSRILYELCSLDRSRVTVVTERIIDNYEVDIAYPIFDIPWESTSENHNQVIYWLLIAFSSSLVPMNPRVSIELFSKVLTFFITKGEFLHGPQAHFQTQAFLQYEATASLQSFSPNTESQFATQSTNNKQSDQIFNIKLM